MRTYELLTILKPNLDAEEVEKFADKLSSTVESLKGKTLETDKPEEKDFLTK